MFQDNPRGPTLAFSCGAISIQAEGKKLLEKDAIAPSAARLCYTALVG
jgi:hypothetical protein